MNEYKENTNKRISLREQRAGASASHRLSGKKEKSSFLIRLNICLTITAAVFLLSRINTELTNKITGKAESIISEELSLSEVKDKAVRVFAAVTSGNKTEDVFSDKNSNIEQSITDTIEQNKELEEQLKNR